MKILIVDDEVSVTRNLEEFLTPRYDEDTILGAITQAEAFEIVEKENPIEIIVLDLALDGGRKGLEVHEKAIALNPKVHTLVVTGNYEAEVENKCLAAGVKKVILKPLTLTTLMEELNKAKEALKKNGR